MRANRSPSDCSETFSALALAQERNFLLCDTSLAAEKAQLITEVCGKNQLAEAIVAKRHLVCDEIGYAGPISCFVLGKIFRNTRGHMLLHQLDGNIVSKRELRHYYDQLVPHLPHDGLAARFLDPLFRGTNVLGASPLRTEAYVDVNLMLSRTPEKLYLARDDLIPYPPVTLGCLYYRLNRLAQSGELALLLNRYRGEALSR